MTMSPRAINYRSTIYRQMILRWMLCLLAGFISAESGLERRLLAQDNNDQPSSTVLPQPRAHAHNDYQHPRPLMDALAEGFCSVEADIFLVNGELLVAHEPSELSPQRTLEALYLNPLLERIREMGGRVYPQGPQFTLLIDFKSEGAATYEALRKQLTRYREMLVPHADGPLGTGGRPSAAVQIIISGDRPIAAIQADPERLVGIDGRLSDLDSTLSADLMPMISDRWPTHFRWRGQGAFPAQERQRLRQIVEQAHAAGRRVRFWATPELPAVWDALLTAGVDHINTDQLMELRMHLSK